MRTKKMNVRLLKILGIVLLVAGLLTALMPGAGAQASQTWYFTDADAPPPFNTAGDLNKIMTKGTEGAVGTIITLEPGKRVWFYSDETAVVDVAFPAGEWGVAYWVKALDSGDMGKSVTTRIYSINSA
ncbi:MAG: hypothetical protein H0M93_03755, partial [Methanophagales archaeon]|nr:hypothetical protein [Methanophagales archaeon]